MVVIEIFTNDLDPFRKDAKELCGKIAKEFEGVEVKEIDINSERGKEKAEFIEVFEPPVILINNDAEFTGLPREEVLRSAVKKELEKERNE